MNYNILFYLKLSIIDLPLNKERTVYELLLQHKNILHIQIDILYKERKRSKKLYYSFSIVFLFIHLLFITQIFWCWKTCCCKKDKKYEGFNIGYKLIAIYL
jgi:hypothetical protein